ncbi:MAG: RNA methyltransferase, partial [Myxococcales bacterium]|nr:RNA methyltransferase [Myxococcales bacterium]
MDGAIPNPVRVILLEPQNALNVGAALRACANMGIFDLVLVRPADYSPDSCARTAPNLDREWSELLVYDSLEEATNDISYLAGFSARRRRANIKQIDLHELPADIPRNASASIGLLFGREDFGLPNPALDRCHVHVSIETGTDYASLNLAQA